MPAKTPTDPSSASLMECLQLSQLANYQARKHDGSIQYYKVWRTWIDLAVMILRQRLRQRLSQSTLRDTNLDEDAFTLPSIDHRATRQLSLQLGVAADNGAMPHGFIHSGARAGYAVGFLPSRVRLLAHILFHTDAHPPLFRRRWNSLMNPTQQHPHFVLDENEEAADDHASVVRLASIGGGPGFDFCATVLVASLHNHRRRRIRGTHQCQDPRDNIIHPVLIDATVFDYETGWHDLAEALATVTNATVSSIYHEESKGKGHKCRFGGKCDITQSLLSHPSNVGVVSLLDTIDLWTCQYCVTENACLLRENDFVFFRELFDHAKLYSMFIFTDTSHRLWPDLVQIATENGLFEVAFVHGTGRWKSGYQLLLQKVDTIDAERCVMTPRDMDLCEGFRRDAEMQKMKLKNGYTRPQPRMSREEPLCGSG